MEKGKVTKVYMHIVVEFKIYEQVNVYKEPVTDPGKKSKKGILTLEKNGGEYVTRTENTGQPTKVSRNFYRILHLFYFHFFFLEPTHSSI